MAEDAGISSDDEIDLDLLDEEELEHRRELAAVISNMKTQLSNYATDRREQDIAGLESLVRDVLDDVAAEEELKRNRTESLPNRDQGMMAETKVAVTNLLGETEAEDLTDHEHEEDGSCYENRCGLAEDMKFLASMPELCGQFSLFPGCLFLPATTFSSQSTTTPCQCQHQIN